MRPLSARSEALEVRDPEDGGGDDTGSGDDGLRSSVTWTSYPEAFGVPQEAQKRAEERRLLPQLAQKGMRTAAYSSSWLPAACQATAKPDHRGHRRARGTCAITQAHSRP